MIFATISGCAERNDGDLVEVYMWRQARQGLRSESSLKERRASRVKSDGARIRRQDTLYIQYPP